LSAGRPIWSELTAAIALIGLVFPLLVSVRYLDLIKSLGTNPILAFAASGAFIIHLSRRPPVTETVATIGLAAIFRLAYAQSFRGPLPYFGAWLISWGSFLGIASLTILMVHTSRNSGLERKRDFFDLIAGAAWFYYWIVLGVALQLTGVLIPRTFDQLLYAFDGSLGFQPSFLLGRLLYRQPLLANWVQTVYFAITLPIAFLYATQRRAGYALGYKIFPLLVAVSVAGYSLYYVLPATGPIYEFPGRFPLVIPPISLHVGEILPRSERAVRNGMPSLHFGAALMLCWNCRIWPSAARAAVWLFMVLTGFATLSLGQHYLIDLVVAFPLILAFHSAGITALPLASWSRWLPITTGLGATFAWLAFLRYGVALCLGRPALSWSLVLVTIAGCFFLESQLWNKTLRHTSGSV
jgi:hypothetical protein